MNITVTANKSAGPIKHFWTNCVGSCHAATALREDWRRQLAQCKKELDFQYVRFHGLLNDDMSVCLRNNETGKIEYSFFNIDSIFDFLLSIGMKPFIELSFMPTALASGPNTVFHYKGNITPPTSYDEWAHLIEALARHLLERYGAEEVRSWFFEVWNEPNLDMFWTGTMEEYFKLYQVTALAIKKADQFLRVGGPSTAIDAWIPEFKSFCTQNRVPLDFITTHHYPTDLAFSLGTNMEERMARAQRGELAWRTRKVLQDASPLTVYYTEWNNSPSPRDLYHDLPYNGAFIVKTIIDILDQPLGCYSFWTFSDIFEECGFSSMPFHGGFGLLTIHGIPKPSYRAFQFLSRLSGNRLPVQIEGEQSTIDCAASQDGDRITILISNHQIPLSPIKTEKLTLHLRGITNIAHAELERIGEEYANPRKAWEAMGMPVNLTEDHIARLLKASEPFRSSCPVLHTEAGAEIRIDDLEPHGVVCISLRLS
ncbi:hypothetical protein [Gracilinema caldarium]|uniref:GH39 family glycosyl hydrolase n=1 Tax=Gracilinema caldarium TaxID=215591 RepID=UPI0026F09DDE|nr:hypothetical protein [Gracilinema caldarium]